MKTRFIIFFLALAVVLIAYFSIYKNVREDYAEGSCITSADCKWAGEGCGGGHGICTNNPKKYENSVSTCDINGNFPANQGYKCTCIQSTKKCGWSR